MSVNFDVTYKGKVVDLLRLLQAVMDGQALPSWIKVDYAELNRFAEKTRARVSVPGVKWLEERAARVNEQR